jgi:imidazole glycerol-phosphate synthase subunit HisH
MNTITIIDYGMCNLDSVSRAVEECGGQPVVTDQQREIELASHIILPGVGAFPEAMQNIKQRSLDQILREQVLDKKIPLLGICLGMQLLASKGLEFTETKGLDLIPGTVECFDTSKEEIRIPHVGWNEVYPTRPSDLFDGIPSGKDFYFVHSYHFCPSDDADILATTPYGTGFVSAVQRGLVYGIQFHPEKSQRMGFALLKNFLAV